MSEEFKKEDRYLVIKRSDIELFMTGAGKNELYRFAAIIESGRVREKKTPLECVVVESDWPIYNDVWKMVEATANKQPTELELLRKERDELVAVFKEVLGNTEEMVTDAYDEFGGYQVHALTEADVSVINETLAKLNQQSEGE